MNPTTKEIGGGPTVGLGNDFVSFLQKMLNTGGMGAAGSPDAVGTTGGIADILNSILGEGAGQLGGALGDILSKDTERGAAALRSRFSTGGGTAFGSPAAYAESMYRAEAAPKTALGIGQLQMGAIAPLLQALGQFSSMGITQRQIVQEQSPFAQIMGTIAPIASAALPFLTPGLGAAGGLARAPNIGSMDLSGIAPVSASGYSAPAGSWGQGL